MFAFALLAAAAVASGATVPDLPLTEDYAASAIGHFSSEAQHAADPRYDWAEARIVRIWPARTDAVWLYHEQAIVNAPGLLPAEARRRPYFQFVARVTQIGPGLLRRDNFRVLDKARWLGMASADPRLAELTPADLAAPSCHNRMEQVALGVWTGRTESCTNAYKGAAWMQSLSVTTRDSYINWDRGFDAANARVWGPAAGGYKFLRVAD